MKQFVQIKSKKYSEEDMFVLIDDIVEFGSYFDENEDMEVYYVDLLDWEDYYFLVKEEYDNLVKKLKEYSL